MSGENGRPWWTKVTPALVVSILVAGASGASYLVGGMEVMHGVVIDVAELKAWREAVDKRSNDRYLEITLRLSQLTDAISETRAQVDAIRQQQVQSADAARATQDAVQSIAGILGAPVPARRH